MSEISIELTGDKIYSLGKFKIEKFKSNYIVIKKNKWIVLQNESQLEIFQKIVLKEKIERLFSYFEEEDIINVLLQLEAKKFEEENLKKNEAKGAYIYLTTECNLRCPHCYMDAGLKKEEELTTEEIKKLLVVLKKLNYTHITYTGGEIFLRDDLCEILEFSKKLNLKNILLTNGILINRFIIEKIYLFIDEIQISIDGYDEQSNSKIRGKDNFVKALEAIELLYEFKLKTAIAVTPIYLEVFKNSHKYKKFAEFILNKYKDNIKIKFSLELMDGRNFKANNQDNKKYNQLLSNIVEEIYPDESLNNFALNYVEGGFISNCGYGDLTFNSNGDVYMCSLINKLDEISNVRKDKFDLEKIEKISTEIKLKTSSLEIHPCKACSLNYICGGGCRIKHLSSLKIEDIISENGLQRFNCNIETKNYFFNLMIKSNDYLYE